MKSSKVEARGVGMLKESYLVFENVTLSESPDIAETVQKFLKDRESILRERIKNETYSYERTLSIANRKGVRTFYLLLQDHMVGLALAEPLEQGHVIHFLHIDNGLDYSGATRILFDEVRTAFNTAG